MMRKWTWFLFKTRNVDAFRLDMDRIVLIDGEEFVIQGIASLANLKATREIIVTFRRFNGG